MFEKNLCLIVDDALVDCTETADSHLGIGLTLSQEAAQAMRGTLSATRLEAENIRFTLSLPPASLSILSSYSQKAPARVRQSHGT